jgi:asparagine synthase (glutamine-hydrolysing)
VPEPFTTFQEIRSVPAGSIIRIDDLGPSDPWRWASIPAVFRSASKSPVPSSREEAQEIVRSAVRETVHYHLVGDVPVGVFLSSGVDSTALVGIASELGGHELKTVTLAFSEFAGRADDESPCAERAAEFYGTDHVTGRVSETEFRDDVQKMLDAMDQPSIDGMNTWMISKKAAELGLKVCLSGLGADELFGGYPSFSQIPRWVRAMSVPSRIPFVSRLWHALFKLSGAQAFGVSPKAAEFANFAGTYRGAYLLKRGLFLPSELPELLGRELAAEGLRRLRVLDYIRTASRPDPGANFARIASMEACLYLRNQLLRDADWAGMAHSVEIRTPFVDTTLLGKVAPVAFTPYARFGKALLAASPAATFGIDSNANLKTGFSIPMGPWVSNLRSTLDAWRGVPSLARDRCHWARRLAYSVYEHVAQ